MKMVVVTISVLFAIPAFGARTINISMPSGAKDLSLSNPSTVEVNYSVQCFDKDGTSTLNLTGQSLQANRSVTHTAGLGDSGTCAGGAAAVYSYTDKNGKKVYYCTANPGAYTSAQNSCGPGQTFCLPYPQYAGCGVYNTSYDIWFKNETGSMKSSDYGCTYSATAAGDYPHGTTAGCGGFQLRHASGGSDVVHSIFIAGSATGPYGASCCESPASGGICKVTITTTGADAHLSSPSFKGGAPF